MAGRQKFLVSGCGWLQGWSCSKLSEKPLFIIQAALSLSLGHFIVHFWILDFFLLLHNSPPPAKSGGKHATPSRSESRKALPE